MRDANPIRTLGDYSKPSHEGYRNTIELPIGNNVVPLRSDTIRLVQNGCSFHGLQSEDPNQHLKDFLKLVDSLDLDARSITTWEDLTTRFLAQFFPSERTTKLRNDILMFQQHHGEALSEYIRPPPHRARESSSMLDGSSSCSDATYSSEQNHYLIQSNLEGLVSNFMASQDARLSKFEADFKQQQSEMTNKIDTVLKSITDRMVGALPSCDNHDLASCASVLLNGSDEYAYSVLEWIGWVRLPSIGMDRMGEHSEAKEIDIRAIGYREVVLIRPTSFLMLKGPEEEPIENEPIMEPIEEG
ncbi:zinc finger, CCHC-type containing protein [Tanacetum coccineum]